MEMLMNLVELFVGLTFVLVLSLGLWLATLISLKVTVNELKNERRN